MSTSGVTPAMAVTREGKGSDYAIAFKDASHDTFDGAQAYKIDIPAKVPAKDFWSFRLYDNNKEGLKRNVDGSFDIYFSPKPPQGQQNNWIQTVLGKAWNVILRLYGLESYFDKSWKPGDPELVE